MSPLISVIVPVYNVEQYLDRCVESIVNQTYQNLEIILVDDGSTDSSGKKCDEWSKLDDRIVVIHKENGGQAEARNFGLERATGEYIGFVDSDDCIDTSMYKGMLEIAFEKNADMVGCDRVLFDENNSPEYMIDKAESNLIEFSREEAIEDIITESHFQSTVWSLLTKADIAKSVMFDVGKIHEDILWPFRAMLKSKKIVYTDKRYYAYFQRNESTMGKRYSAKRFDALDALKIRAGYARDYYPKLYHKAVRAYLGACMYHYQFLCRQPKCEEYTSYKSILHHRFCVGDQAALFDGLGIKYKFWYSFFRKAPNLTCKIRNKLKIGL